MGYRAPQQWSDGGSLIVVLIVSLGLWAAMWAAVASVSAAL